MVDYVAIDENGHSPSLSIKYESLLTKSVIKKDLNKNKLLF